VWQHLKVNRADGMISGSVIDALEHKRQQTHKLCSAGRSIGHLSGTDGCVVLDKSLVISGFGGSIRVDNAPLSKRCLEIIGKEEREIEESILLLRFGERHKSAHNLCKRVPGTLAFVISQDDDLRLFTSDDTTVYCYDLLHP
jgi:hypothetical protein